MGWVLYIELKFLNRELTISPFPYILQNIGKGASMDLETYLVDEVRVTPKSVSKFMGILETDFNIKEIVEAETDEDRLKASIPVQFKLLKSVSMVTAARYHLWINGWLVREGFKEIEWLTPGKLKKYLKDQELAKLIESKRGASPDVKVRRPKLLDNSISWRGFEDDAD